MPLCTITPQDRSGAVIVDPQRTPATSRTSTDTINAAVKPNRVNLGLNTPRIPFPPITPYSNHEVFGYAHEPVYEARLALHSRSLVVSCTFHASLAYFCCCCCCCCCCLLLHVSSKKNNQIKYSRAGEAELAELALPTRKQEPYRYTDLESLYRTDFTSAKAPSSEAGDAAAATAAAVAPYMLEACRGQQMVFVNGVFSEELSDVSALGGVEGLVAGHIGAMEGASLDQVGYG